MKGLLNRDGEEIPYFTKPADIATALLTECLNLDNLNLPLNEKEAKSLGAKYFRGLLDCPRCGDKCVRIITSDRNRCLLVTHDYNLKLNKKFLESPYPNDIKSLKTFNVFLLPVGKEKAYALDSAYWWEKTELGVWYITSKSLKPIFWYTVWEDSDQLVEILLMHIKKNSNLFTYRSSNRDRRNTLLNDEEVTKFVRREIWLNGGLKCAITGKDLTFDNRDGLTGKMTPSLDRMDPNGFYTIDNCRLVGFWENSRKLDSDPLTLSLSSRYSLEGYLKNGATIEEKVNLCKEILSVNNDIKSMVLNFMKENTDDY